MLSGWCGQRGKPACKWCRSDLCSCRCHGAKAPRNNGLRGGCSVESETKRGPDRVNESDPLATDLRTQKGGLV